MYAVSFAPSMRENGCAQSAGMMKATKKVAKAKGPKGALRNMATKLSG